MTRQRKAEPPGEDPRNKLMARLQEHAGLSGPEVQHMKGLIVALDYFCLPNHSGGVISATQRYYRRDGAEHTFDDVSLSKIIDEVESHIKSHVPSETRTEVYHRVLSGMPGHKETPDWDKAKLNPLNPNENPATPFSKPPEDRTNQQLLNDLAAAANLPPKTAAFVGCQIAWWDACADGQSSCMMSPGTCELKGGRLGRDHTLEDVPIHYFRDMLMDYIDTQLSEDKRAAARQAICAELTETQIEEYIRLLAQAKKEREERLASSLPERRLEYVKEQLRYDSRPARSVNKEATEIVQMWEALNSIDPDVNLDRDTFECATRNPDCPKMIALSVVRPFWPPIPEERHIECQTSIYHSCDQVRAMIKVFVTEGEWDLEQFRQTLGRVSRKQLITFLTRRGNTHQLYSAAYQLSWEFFDRRERLGLPLRDVSVMGDIETLERLQRRRLRDTKRTRNDARGDASQGKDAKRRKKAQGRPALQEIVNQAD